MGLSDGRVEENPRDTGYGSLVSLSELQARHPSSQDHYS
jgi:hypothetical protein